MIKVAVVGGAGYIGGELIRLLIAHPQVKLTQIISQSQEGKALSEVHPDLLHSKDQIFEKDLDPTRADAIFLAQPHGAAQKLLESLELSDDSLIIDLSHDHRWQQGWTYGLPEFFKEPILQSKRIANPGCFATAIQLGLLPLAKTNSLTNRAYITAVTGSTGAGQSPTATSHFSWRHNNLSIYKSYSHQHESEILSSIHQVQETKWNQISFVPMRGCFTRGILASIQITNPKADKNQIIEGFLEAYDSSPFVAITETSPHIKQVSNTNNVAISVDCFEQDIHIVVAIDNLLKGAAGTAIQNFNIINHLPEDLGLQLKPTVY